MRMVQVRGEYGSGQSRVGFRLEMRRVKVKDGKGSD